MTEVDFLTALLENAQGPAAGVLAAAIGIWVAVLWRLGSRLISVLMEMKNEMASHNQESRAILDRLASLEHSINEHRLSSGNGHGD